MNAILELILSRGRTIGLTLLLLLLSGGYAYRVMPKESAPDIAIPIMYVSMRHEGISPEDAERLLIRPMEKKLRSIAGIKELKAVASEGHAAVILEFKAGFDNKKALRDVREKVDLAKPDLPRETDEPVVKEVNFSLFPVIAITLSGPVSETALVRIARDLRERIEGIPQVLEVDISGDRQDEIQILIDPAKLEQYHLRQEELIALTSGNNQLIPAGSIETDQGEIVLKVPGLFKTVQDILDLPIKTLHGKVLTVKDVGTVTKTHKDSQTYARVNGQAAVALEVKKRTGENVIQTIDAVRAVVEVERKRWPESIQVDFLQDNSKEIKNMLLDLQNNIISAIILVMVVIVAALGVRTAGIVGVAIPGSFFTGLLALHLMGYTINTVVLFGLIMSVGMLVDGAIIITELADRKMLEGFSPAKAYLIASQRMAWPVISSNATTMAAFLPLLFWPGIVGEFMKFLPITVITILSASVLVALVFVPCMGGVFGKPGDGDIESLKALESSEKVDLTKIKGYIGFYVRLLKPLIRHPYLVFSTAIGMLICVYGLYFKFGRGVEFFPNIEPEQANLYVHMRGDLSLNEIDRLVKEVESRVLGMHEFKSIYATSFSKGATSSRGSDLAEDVKGVIMLEFIDWEKRRPADTILKEVLEKTQDIYGVHVEVVKKKEGPPIGKPVVLNISSRDPDLLDGVVRQVVKKFKSMQQLKDVEDSRPVPGIEWQIQVDREEAARYGASVQSVGNLIQLTSRGLKIGAYRPYDSDDEVDIRVRYAREERSLDSISKLRLETQAGLVPIANFTQMTPQPKVTQIERYNQRRYIEVKAELQEGALADTQIQELSEWLASEAEIPEGVFLEFKGEDQEQREAQAFLGKAFLVALFIMFIIIVTQFDNLFQAMLVLSAVLFSTIGVFLGLLIMNEPFDIVMHGIGIVSLAGIVVNHNIVLIDAYAYLRKQGLEVVDAILRTGAQRLRPVFLTTITTILGLIPMALQLNIDFVNRLVSVGAPSTQWWVQLSTSVSFGLAFSTILTLLVTPVMIVLGSRFFESSPKP